MSINIPKVEVIEFEDMVKKEYEARGFKLRDTIRLRTNVVGKEIKFPVIRGGLAYEKAPQDDVIPMNLDYSRATATMKPYVAPEYTDLFSQQTINFDEKREVAMQSAAAVGRRQDQQIIDALNLSATSKTIADAGAGMTYEKFIEAAEKLDEDAVDVMDRYLIIPAAGARQLLKEQEFISSDFINNRVLNTSSGLDGQQVLGFNIIIIPNMREGGLPQTGDIVTCYAYHKMSMGMGLGVDFRTTIDWIPQKRSWLTVSEYSGGAVAVDDLGIVKIDIDVTK